MLLTHCMSGRTKLWGQLSLCPTQSFSVCYESGSEKTQPEIQFCKVCQSVRLVGICSFRKELMVGMPPVLLGEFDNCKITSTQIRDVISNHRQ